MFDPRKSRLLGPQFVLVRYGSLELRRLRDHQREAEYRRRIRVAPTFNVSSNTADQTGATFPVTAPAFTSGDQLLAFEQITGSANTPSTPSGWKLQDAIAGTTTNLSCFFKPAASGLSNTFNNDSGGTATVYVLSITGAATTPEGDSKTAGNSTTADPGTYTTTNDNDLILTAWGCLTSSGITPDGSYTPLGTIGLTATLNVGYKTQASAGVVNSRTASMGLASVNWTAILAALSPAADDLMGQVCL